MTDQEKAPEGTIIIKRMGFDKLYNIEDLEFLKELSIGQIFNSVARHYGKQPKDYGAQWLRFRTPQGDVSKQFTYMYNELAKLNNDLERFNMVCGHLGEEPLQLGE